MRALKILVALSGFLACFVLIPLSSAWSATVSGRVSENGSGGLQGIEVRLWFSASEGYAILHSTTTDENGDYLFSSVEEGTYKLDCQMSYVPGGGSENWVRTWYDVEEPSGGGLTFDEADEILVSTGPNLFDLHMSEGGGLDGRVLVDSVATGGIYVQARRKGDAGVFLNRTTEVQSPLTGKFYFRGLPPGNYSLIAYDSSGVKGTGVFEGPYTVAAGLNGYAGDLVPPDLPDDPYEPNNYFYRATSIDVSGLRLFPQVPWESSSTTIAPLGDDADYFCFSMLAGDRFSIRTETPLTVDGETSSHPWMDPVIGFFRSNEYPVLKDNNSGSGGLNAWIDTGELTESGNFCVAVSTSGDMADFDGVGQSVAGEYTLRIEMANRVPRLSVTYGDDNPVPHPPGLIGANENEELVFHLAFSDPDRDTVAVDAELFDSTGEIVDENLSWVTDPEEGMAELTWNIDEAASEGSPYEFRFTATDGALSSLVQVNVRVYGSNLAPTTPVLVSPELGAEIATSLPSLTITNSSDPDNDELLYAFEIYYGENPLANPDAVVQQIGLALENESGITSWIPSQLPENTWIYWRARADDRQISNSYSAWTLPGRFFVNSVNDAPLPPVMAEPSFNEVIYSREVTLEAYHTTDPEGDDVALIFQVASDDLFLEIISESPELEQDSLADRASWPLDLKLDWSTTYYARCLGVDSHGKIGEPGPTVRFSIAPNTLPESPVLAAPFQSLCEEQIYRFSLPESFEVTNVLDPGGDDVYYHLQVFDFDDPPDYPLTVPIVDALYASAPYPAETTLLPVDPELFQENAHYRIRVRAWDEYGYTPFTECDFYINLTDEPPLEVTILSPENGEVFPSSTTEVMIEVQNTSDPDKHLFGDDGNLMISYCYDDEPFPNGCDNGELNWTDIPQSSELVEDTTFFTIQGLERDSRVYLEVCGLHRSCGEKTALEFRINDNLPPAQPTIFFPREGYVSNVLRISTFGKSNGDPDEDFVELAQFELSTQESFETVLATSHWVERQYVETLSDWGFYWEPPISLVYNQEYWIRMRDRDMPPSGIAPGASEWSVVHFSTVETNSPPDPPEILAPLNGELLQGLEFVAEGRPLGDPNEDEINGLFFELSDDEGFNTSLQNSGWVTERTPEGTLQWHVTGLEIGTRYWMRVKSRDVGWLDESAWSKIGFLSRSTNEPPTIPVWIAPPAEGDGSFRSFPVEIIWQDSIDADGDEIYYTVELSRVEDFPSGSVLTLAEDHHGDSSGAFETLVLTEDDVGGIQDLAFFLRIRARDELGQTSGWAVTRAVINTANRAPELVDISVLPSPAYSHSDLVATATTYDPDGDQLFETWRWWRYNDGNWIEHSNTTQRLLASQTLPGDLWKVDCTISDGQREVGPIEVHPFEILDYCEDYNPCTHNIWTPNGCDNRAFDNGSYCELDDREGRCAGGVCLTRSGSFCDRPYEISVGTLHQNHLLYDTAFVGEECFGENIEGADFFFQFNPLQDVLYRVTVETPTEGVALALAYLESCPLLPGCSDQVRANTGESFVSMEISSNGEEPLLFLATAKESEAPANLPLRVRVRPVCTSNEDCDDGVDCTEEICNENGACEYLPNHTDCADDIYCNGEERCLPFAGCSPGEEVDCSDGVDCTEDTCDEAIKGCTHEAKDSLCDDGIACNGAETCDISAGCLPGLTPDCDDDVECTIDRCLESSGAASCTHVPFHKNCDDGESCTEDICLPGNDGGCRHFERPNDTICTSGSLTSPNPGVCQAGICKVSCDTDEDCNDAIPCTTDRCKTDRTCENLPSHALCDDDHYCNGVERCAPGIGCVAGENIVCDDGVNCTEDECSESLDRCVYLPRNFACSNGRSCDGLEICDKETGCYTISIPNCDDQISCTRDTCMESPDGPLCTYEAKDTDTCDDGRRCTYDRCNPDSGCENVALPNGSSCDDGNHCNGFDTCAEGICQPGVPPECDDDDPCTMTGCNPSRGCFGMVAEDWSSCGEDLACFDGVCTAVHEADDCHEAPKVELGVEWITTSRDAHPYADPHDYECLLPPVSGSDFFFRVELGAGGDGHEISIRTLNSDEMDLALVLWEDACPDEEDGSCFKAYRDEGTRLTAYVSPLTRSVSLVGQVVIPSPELQSKSDLAILVERVEFETDGDEDADEDLDWERADRERIETETETEAGNEDDIETETTKKKKDSLFGCGQISSFEGAVPAWLLLLLLVLARRRITRQSA